MGRRISAPIRGATTLSCTASHFAAVADGAQSHLRSLLADASFSIMGMRLNVPTPSSPDRARHQRAGVAVADTDAQHPAGSQCGKNGQNVPIGFLGAVRPDIPSRLEVVRRVPFASPRLDPAAVNLTIGVQADTRIVPNETKPDCPFPAELDIAASGPGTSASQANRHPVHRA
jgi:hypothetical protein